MIHELAFTLDADTGDLHIDSSVPGTAVPLRKAGLRMVGQGAGYRSYRGKGRDLGPEELYCLLEAVRVCRDFASTAKKARISREKRPSRNESSKTGASQPRADLRVAEVSR